MAYNLRTGLIGSGDIDVNVSLSNLNAANITSGTFDLARIPTLGNSFPKLHHKCQSIPAT